MAGQKNDVYLSLETKLTPPKVYQSASHCNVSMGIAGENGETQYKFSECCSDSIKRREAVKALRSSWRVGILSQRVIAV